MSESQGSTNPFSAPAANSSDKVVVAVVAEENETFAQIAKRVFLAWEKLRLAYIGILGALTLLLGWSTLRRDEFWLLAIGGGLVSNACYFAGPIVETYVTWLGYRGRWLRWLMFVLGTLFTMLAAIAAIFSLAIPTQN